MLMLARGKPQKFNERIASNSFEVRKETLENDSLRLGPLRQAAR